MDRRESTLEVLSQSSGDRALPSIPGNVAIAVFVILSISGFLIGAILPELIADRSSEHEVGEVSREALYVLISSTIPAIEISGTSYSDIPVPTAFQVLFSGESSSEDNSAMDDELREMLEWILGKDMRYRLKVTPGSGITGPDYVIGEEMDKGPDCSAVREVAVGLGEEQGSVVFDLRVWRLS
ncbi:MAG: hypothetical protein JXA22_02095 [Candidatus Thermoplasmatota archaeon]|nr:hypothetical protein [Candidatus Thermoplasmatota archaeon]